MSQAAAQVARPKRRPRKARRPVREYVVVDSATEDASTGEAAVEAWLAEPSPR